MENAIHRPLLQLHIPILPRRGRMAPPPLLDLPRSRGHTNASLNVSLSPDRLDARLAAGVAGDHFDRDGRAEHARGEDAAAARGGGGGVGGGWGGEVADGVAFGEMAVDRHRLADAVLAQHRDEAR